jgi:hypothetical protein
MGPRAKGYCQLRHKEATGVYTGSRLNPGRKKTSIMESAEFTLSEALFHNGGYVETTITPEDLETPVEWIFSEEDPYFDPTWEPDAEIAQLCEMIAENLNDFAGEDSDSDLGNEEDSVFYDDDGFGLGDDGAVFSVRKDKDKDDIPDDLTPEEIEALRMEKISRTRDLKVKKKGRYTPQTQPRDSSGKFRQVLARLKLDLGTAGLNKAIEKVEEIENLDFSGDYERAVKASEDLITLIDRVDTKAINPESIEGIREGSRALGETIANLPFAFGEQSKKIRYSDVPPALQGLMKDMIKRVEEKIGKEDANEATSELRTFMSGGDYFSQADISSQMSKLLRLLT